MWPKYKPNMAYLNLAANNDTEDGMSAQQGYRWQYVYFWTETLPSQLEQSTCSREDANSKCRIGETEGWNLTPKDAVVLLNILLVLCIFLVCLVLMTCAVACGLSEAVRVAKYGGPKGKRGYVSKSKPDSSLRREHTDMWRVNEAFLPDSDEEANTHL